jgi:hypothetical protein
LAASDPSPSAFSSSAFTPADPERSTGDLSTDSKAYSRRARQIKAYFGAPSGKPIGAMTKAMCTALVAAYCVKTTARALARKDARDAVQGSVWRHKTDFSAQFAPSAMPTRDTHEQRLLT